MAEPLSDLQQQVIRIVPRITAGLSVAGSSSILFSVIMSYRNSDRRSNMKRSRSRHSYHNNANMSNSNRNHNNNDDDNDDNDDDEAANNCKYCYCCNNRRNGNNVIDNSINVNTRASMSRRKNSSSSSTIVVGRTLLLGMSLTDLISSLSYVIGNVAYPKENGGQGNQTTCNSKLVFLVACACALCTNSLSPFFLFKENKFLSLTLSHTQLFLSTVFFFFFFSLKTISNNLAQGFMCNLQVGAAIYSGFLAWYYCLYIRYQWKDTKLQQYFEPIAHLVSWFFVLTTGIVAIVLQLYNPHWIRCYISGPNSNIYFWFFFFVPIWTSMIFGSIAMLLIYCQVRKIESRSILFSFQKQTMLFQGESGQPITTASGHNDNNDNINNGPVSRLFERRQSSLEPEETVASNHHNNTEPQELQDLEEQQQREIQRQVSSFSVNGNTNANINNPQLSDLPKTRRVAYQGLGYTAAFILVYIFPTTSRTWQTVNSSSGIPPPYVIRVLALSLVPCQGFFNFLVYHVQPRIYDWWFLKREQHKQHQPARPSQHNPIRSTNSNHKDMNNTNGLATGNDNDNNNDQNNGDNQGNKTNGNDSFHPEQYHQQQQQQIEQEKQQVDYQQVEKEEEPEFY